MEEILHHLWYMKSIEILWNMGYRIFSISTGAGFLPSTIPFFQKKPLFLHLVGGWTAHLENIDQHGNLPQVGVNIKNIWNHHLVIRSLASKINLKYVIPKSLKVGHWLSELFLHACSSPLFLCWPSLRLPRSHSLVLPGFHSNPVTTLRQTKGENESSFFQAWVTYHGNP